MGNSRKGDAHPSRTAQEIISRFIPEHSRLSGTTNADHLESLAAELGVKSRLTRPLTGIKDQHPGVDAMLVPLPGGYSVVINENAPYGRQRFSLAHELGHIMLLATETSTLTSPTPTRYRSSNSAVNDTKAEEHLCDAIAAELLMPEKMFTDEIRKFGASLMHLSRLANVFDTSLTATAIRYRDLLPEPCHLIQWESSIRRNGDIVAEWKMRDRVPGPYLHPVVGSSSARPNEFSTVRKNWSTLKKSKSLESLLVNEVIAGKRYVQTRTFEAESMGFGYQKSRAALTAVYLSRIHEGT